MDDDIFNKYLRGAQFRSICFSCNNYGHLSTNCLLRTTKARQDTLTNASPPSDSTHGIVTNNSITAPTQPFRAHSDSVINPHSLYFDSIIAVNAHIPTFDTCTDAEFVLGHTHILPVPSKRTRDFFPLPDTVVFPININIEAVF